MQDLVCYCNALLASNCLIRSQVVLRAGNHPELVDPKAFDDFHHRRLQWPSINTLSREAFNWYIGPHLTPGEKHLLDTYWAGLPRFHEEMPNTNPRHPGQRATPKQLPNGDWDWSEMLQPIRWFMCPCALGQHECEYTGYHLMQCQGWRGICCNRVGFLRPYSFGENVSYDSDLQARAQHDPDTCRHRLQT